MRADRVLAMLLLLQARGRITATELAGRLEVSKRTVYRDVVALSAAGVPVHADPGPSGGIELMAGWRTDLTGLTASEVEALFTSAAGPQFESAMGKLAAALPGESGKRAGRIRERLLVDSAGWGRRSVVSPHLRMVQDAVFADRRLHLTYRRAEAQIVARDVDPLGLIIKAGVWYLLADIDGARRLFRLSRIEAARAWREQSAHWESGRAGYEVVLKVAKVDDLALVLRVAGDRVVGRPRGGLVRLAFPALEPAAAFISSFGVRVEVVQPDEVRADLARRGAELMTLYGTKKGRPPKRPAVSKS